MDRGEGAVFGTIDFWDSRDILYLGIFRTEEERNTNRKIVEKNGIRVGFLSYSYGLNGFALPRDKPWLVGLIDKEVMAREIDDLRPHCDLLVVSMHWGDEFRETINAWQRDLVAFLAEHKVDLILGHHPHVTAPLEIIERPDGGQLTVFYSLGDFLSHTHSRSTPNTITGVLGYIRVKKLWETNRTSTTVDFVGVIPTVSHYSRDRTPFVVYPLWDYSDELASRHAVGTIFGWNWGTITLDRLYRVANTIFPDRVIDKEEFEELQNFIVQNSQYTQSSRRASRK
jgi:poly-gamma-glutamate synthesis protein (capsule biosynthesis protein)